MLAKNYVPVQNQAAISPRGHDTGVQSGQKTGFWQLLPPVARPVSGAASCDRRGRLLYANTQMLNIEQASIAAGKKKFFFCPSLLPCQGDVAAKHFHYHLWKPVRCVRLKSLQTVMFLVNLRWLCGPRALLQGAEIAKIPIFKKRTLSFLAQLRCAVAHTWFLVRVELCANRARLHHAQTKLRGTKGQKLNMPKSPFAEQSLRNSVETFASVWTLFVPNIRSPPRPGG